MEMTKQRKMLLSVLGLGLGLLVLDRFVLSAPDSASADLRPDIPQQAVAPAPEVPAPDQPEPGVDTGPSLPSYATLTERLIAAQSSGSAHPGGADGQPAEADDPFQLPKDWRPAAADPVPGVKRTAPTQDTKSAQLLLNSYRLEGTYRSINGEQVEKLAVVSGKPMRIGDTVQVDPSGPGVTSGASRFYMLVDIDTESRTVTWESSDKKLRVVMHTDKL